MIALVNRGTGDPPTASIARESDSRDVRRRAWGPHWEAYSRRGTSKPQGGALGNSGICC